MSDCKAIDCGDLNYFVCNCKTKNRYYVLWDRVPVLDMHPYRLKHVDGTFVPRTGRRGRARRIKRDRPGFVMSVRERERTEPRGQPVIATKTAETSSTPPNTRCHIECFVYMFESMHIQLSSDRVRFSNRKQVNSNSCTLVYISADISFDILFL